MHECREKARRPFLNKYNTLGLLHCVGGEPYNRQVLVAHIAPGNNCDWMILSHAQSAVVVMREG